MQVDGGYIVVGAADGGQPSSEVAMATAGRYDEASVRNILKKWIPEPFHIRIGRHVIDGCNLVLIYVAPNLDGMCVFSADGQYANDAGKSTTVFRAGDIYARHGSKSERMAQHDIVRIVRRLVAAEKDRWGQEIIETLQPQVSQGLRAQQLAHGLSRLIRIDGVVVV
jgi:predicted HTH transcriptional regulator